MKCSRYATIAPIGKSANRHTFVRQQRHNIRRLIKGRIAMEYINTGVSEQAIGIPSEEEREKLKRDGYTLMISHISNNPDESYELWLK